MMLLNTVRREYVDCVFFWNEIDLVRKLEDFRLYYNADRVHRSLDGTTPAIHAGAPFPALANLQHLAWKPRCRGLFQLPVAS